MNWSFNEHKKWMGELCISVPVASHFFYAFFAITSFNTFNSVLRRTDELRISRHDWCTTIEQSHKTYLQLLARLGDSAKR